MVGGVVGGGWVGGGVVGAAVVGAAVGGGVPTVTGLLTVVAVLGGRRRSGRLGNCRQDDTIDVVVSTTAIVVVVVVGRVVVVVAGVVVDVLAGVDVVDDANVVVWLVGTGLSDAFFSAPAFLLTPNQTAPAPTTVTIDAAMISVRQRLVSMGDE